VKRLSRTFKIISVFLVLFLVWVLFAPCLAEFLIVEKPLPKADAIFVLGGSSAYVERSQQAALAYKQGISSKIFLTNDGLKSGWNKIEKRNPYFVEKARWELIAQGVPENAIEILPGTVYGTQDEAELFAKTFQEKHLHSVLLVTSAYHSRRTFWTFEREAARNNLPIEIGIEPAPTGQQTPPTSAWWIKRNGWQWIAGEYIKGLYYWLFY
jgi:uncharacterized SAM-binding protein YcdF (DUF218 family)